VDDHLASSLADMLQPFRDGGFTFLQDGLTLVMEHRVLGRIAIDARTVGHARQVLESQTRRLNHEVLDAIRAAVDIPDDDLVMIWQLARLTAAFDPSGGLTVAGLGILCDHGRLDDSSYLWVRQHAGALMSWLA